MNALESSKSNKQTIPVKEYMDTPKTLEALADAFELLSIAFSFPTIELAEALCAGTFQSDLDNCLNELGISKKVNLKEAKEPQVLLQDLRKEYSRLYLQPGKFILIYPYESAFLYKLRGKEGFPSLIANPTTIDVERFMKTANALPENARTEPADSIFTELRFLSYLYTQVLSITLSDLDDKEKLALQWLTQANSFFQKHINNWVPAFLSATEKSTNDLFYSALSNTSSCILEKLRHRNHVTEDA